jgi:ATP-dependent Clp protease ATP-binding subunit ClpA
METALSEVESSILGQSVSLRKVLSAVFRYQNGLSPERRPAGIFLLAGPTGVGKTATVEALAKYLHGNPHNYLNVNCAEYSTSHEVARLIGAPPGYLGHRETKPAFTQVALNATMSERNNLSIVLLDEIEKAHSAFYQIFLSIFDKGILKTGDGNTVNFERTIIFLTSNLGSANLKGSPGFEKVKAEDSTELSDVATEARIRRAVKEHFSPEFVNRLDETLVYKHLTPETVSAILDLEKRNLQFFLDNRLGDAAPFLTYGGGVDAVLLKEGYSREYGARALKRVFTQRILTPVSDSLREFTAESVAKFGDNVDVNIHISVNPGSEEFEFNVVSGRDAVAKAAAV